MVTTISSPLVFVVCFETAKSMPCEIEENLAPLQSP